VGRTLFSLLAWEFDASSRTRGQAYYREGRVRIQYGSAKSVVAQVRGSGLYQASLVWDGEMLDMDCSCPYFDAEGPCKHLWATVLAADASGYLRAASPEPVAREPRPHWRGVLENFQGPIADGGDAPRGWPAGREIHYVVDVQTTLAGKGLAFELLARDPKKDGSWSKWKILRWERSMSEKARDPEDRKILALLRGARPQSGYYDAYMAEQRYSLESPLAEMVMPFAARTGRCWLRKDPQSEWSLLEWDQGGEWRLALKMEAQDKRWVVSGVLRRDDEEIPLAAPAMLTRGGLVFANGRVAPLAGQTPFGWIDHLRKTGALTAPAEDGEELLRLILEAPEPPEVLAPEELRYEVVPGEPRPGLKVRQMHEVRGSYKLQADVWFEYEGMRVWWIEQRQAVLAPGRRLVRRVPQAEAAAMEVLRRAGFRQEAVSWQRPQPVWELAPKKLPGVVRTLLEAGWHVEAEGKTFRRPGAFRLEIASGVDWFELHGEVDYDGTPARLPELLEALRRGENLVRLDDGAYGLLPEEWLARLGPLVGMGSEERDHVRFRRTQAGLLDALLAAQPETRFDETFARAREELRRFEGVRPAQQPEGFAGELRGYQKEGLGWMHFLRDFGFGGCLADDMGVGKTAQVLALLEERRTAGVGPSLVVVPKSLVFNWKLEAARFTPGLRVLDYTGPGRREHALTDWDLIVTTYGTLRRDVPEFQDREFDYVVLDEAQAIKNAETESAKAVRLLRGRHRLALSGTPVENHLGELWSLFEFLNPGMLGTARVFQGTGGALRNPSEATRRVLAQALRPFILRRTKQQVAAELPPKTEQTVYCELEPEQRRLYDELRAHYRSTLLGRVDREGLAKSKIQVLEALLRLRQAACHPGLLDAGRAGEPSAKVEMLLDQLAEVREEGHKALVYSQFTSFLAIVRRRLDEEGVTYEYLDGKTRDRQARVERFQGDPECPLFLISLKAGGLGLNLTAAEYVFLLDPWWNPAVEAQAVDRAHRIGQTQQVFAYRLIAQDTVEEKVLELQKTKRDLAAAILGEEASLIRDLRREDLELLLS
jgi:superfamily II DNA or RNA helicase